MEDTIVETTTLDLMSLRSHSFRLKGALRSGGLGGDLDDAVRARYGGQRKHTYPSCKTRPLFPSAACCSHYHRCRAFTVPIAPFTPGRIGRIRKLLETLPRGIHAR